MPTTTIDDQLKTALNALFTRTDVKNPQIGHGLSPKDAQSPFLKDMRYQRTFTPRQMQALHNALRRYESQLKNIGIEIPTVQEVGALVGTIEEAKKTAHPCIDMKESFIEIRFPFPNYSPQMDIVKNTIHARGLGRCRYSNVNGDNHWTVPYSEEAFQIILEQFQLSFTELTEAARKVHKEITAREVEKEVQVLRYNAELEREAEKLYASIHEEYVPGKFLYTHQKSGIKFLLRRERALIGDQAGLGKTAQALLTAHALQKLYGYRILVVTNVSNTNDWERLASEIGADIAVCTYAKIPVATNEFPDFDFALIKDETHHMQNMTSAQTRQAIELSWHPRCKKSIALTGTPIRNRAANLIGLLLVLKHPLVYVPFDVQYPIIWPKRYSKKQPEKGFPLSDAIKAKIKAYEEKFCGGKLVKVGRNTIWETKGSTNNELLHRLTTYVEGAADNHEYACMIHRLKKDCTDLPDKQRIKQTAEMSPEAIQTFEAAVVGMTKNFEENCKRKLEEFIVSYTEEHRIAPTESMVKQRESGIQRAETVVLKQIYRHASAKAKIEFTVEMALEILAQDEKIVIFSQFVEVAKEIKARIEESIGKDTVGFIAGEVPAKERFRVKDAFQDETSSMRAIVSTAAGGESITLNVAQYMILNDRPWTFADADQQESRCHRIGNKGNVTIYWPQLPKKISDSDIRIDGLLEVKERVSNEIRYGHSDGIEFQEEKDIAEVALGIIFKTASKIKSK